MLLKIGFEKQIHLYKGDMSLHGLKRHCRNVFNTIPNTFQFYYIDNDQDSISITSQQDLDIMFDSHLTPSIKKIFIKQTESQFQLLTANQYESNPQEYQVLTKQNNCQLTDIPINSAKDIKVINIFEETVKKCEEDLLTEEIEKYLFGIENSLIQSFLQQEQKVIEKEVTFYLSDLTNNIISQLNKQQQNLVKKEVSKSLDSIVNDCTTKIAKNDQIKRQQRQREENILKIDSDLINKLLDEKMSKLLPSLIKRVTKAVQDRICIDGCTKCKNKQTELEFQNLVRSQLMKKAKRFEF